MLGTIVLVLLILMLLGSFPRWRYSREWGYSLVGIISTQLCFLTPRSVFFHKI